ncbi:MAG: zf-HC2 domain-containing protein [Armatimonadota bacterium]|nr:zf-HC2 domain-containing protein [Armatimonadota bacterium]
MDTLDCETARRYIHLRLDGELTDEDAHLLEEHLAHCARCRKACEALTRIDRALRSAVQSPRAPQDLAAKATERVHRAAGGMRLWRTWVPAAAAFLIAAGLLLLLRPAPEPEPAVSTAPAIVLSGGDAIHVFEPDARVAQSGRTGELLPERSVAWALSDTPTTLAFADGAEVSLNEEAVVRIGRASVDLFTGRLRADLRLADEPFTVSTPWGDVAGEHAVFIVRLDADSSSARVHVLDGDVTIAADGGQETVSAGQTAELQLDPEQEIML